VQQRGNRQQIIAVDVDDVLKESSQFLVGYSNRKWGTSLTIDDYNEHWAEMWQVDAAEMQRRAEHIHAEGLLVHGEPFDDTKQVLEKLKERYTLVVTTSRQRLIMKQTQEWLKAYFGELFSEVHFAGIWDDIEIESAIRAQMTKAQLLKDIGAHYLVDDHPKHCLAAAELGIESLLFGSYPWNQNIDLPKGVTRVSDWQGVAVYFDGQQ